MLKITILKGGGSTALKLEGKLAGPWVEELEKTWYSLGSSPEGRRVVVDLCGVTFVDASGKNLLARMYQGGASFLADMPMTKQIVEEIESGQMDSS